MALHTFDRQLRLLGLLTNNHTLNVNEVAAEMGMGRRQIYRYISEFMAAGFQFDQQGSIYRLLPSSPFFRELTHGTYFTREEAEVLFHLVAALPNPTPQLRHIRTKLHQQFDVDACTAQQLDERLENNLRAIVKAIDECHCAILHDYTSYNSQRTSDRFVEPFALINGNTDVRCYEPSSGMTKTFRLTRMKNVEVCNEPWQHADLHNAGLTDLFGFSGSTPHSATLRLTLRSYQLLCEEHPEAEQHVIPQDDGTFILHTDYCHPAGIGRFILGLPGEVTIIDSPELTAYIDQQLTLWQQK